MSTVFGGIVVCQSNDFDGDKEAICDVLNRIGAWDEEGDIFVVEEEIYGERIVFSSVVVNFPTAFPNCPERVERELHTAALLERKPVLGRNVLVPLDEICRKVSAYIQSGELTIACSRQQADLCSTFGSLTVRSDGSGVRVGIEVDIYQRHELREECEMPADAAA